MVATMVAYDASKTMWVIDRAGILIFRDPTTTRRASLVMHLRRRRDSGEFELDIEPLLVDINGQAQFEFASGFMPLARRREVSVRCD